MGTHGVYRATSDRERAEAIGLRYAVLALDGAVPPEAVTDEHELECEHFVAYDDFTPVGAARLRSQTNTLAAVETVVVIDAFRGRGWGNRLVRTIEETARDEGFTRLELAARAETVGFYDQLGYERRDVSESTNAADDGLKRMEKAIA